MQLHYRLFTLVAGRVRGTIVAATIHGMNQGFHDFELHVDGTHRDSQDYPPEHGALEIAPVPELTRLVAPEDVNSLAKRGGNWGISAPVAPVGGSVKQQALFAPGSKRAAKKRRKPLKRSRLKERAARHGQAGEACTRAGCPYTHMRLCGDSRAFALCSAAHGSTVIPPGVAAAEQPAQATARFAAWRPSVANCNKMAGGGRGG